MIYRKPYVEVDGNDLDVYELESIPALLSAVVAALIVVLWGPLSWPGLLALAAHCLMSQLTWAWNMDVSFLRSLWSPFALAVWFTQPISGLFGITALGQTFYRGWRSRVQPAQEGPLA